MEILKIDLSGGNISFSCWCSNSRIRFNGLSLKHMCYLQHQISDKQSIWPPYSISEHLTANNVALLNYAKDNLGKTEAWSDQGTIYINTRNKKRVPIKKKTDVPKSHIRPRTNEVAPADPKTTYAAATSGTPATSVEEDKLAVENDIATHESTNPPPTAPPAGSGGTWVFYPHW